MSLVNSYNAINYCKSLVVLRFWYAKVYLTAILSSMSSYAAHRSPWYVRTHITCISNVLSAMKAKQIQFSVNLRETVVFLKLKFEVLLKNRPPQLRTKTMP